MKKLTLSPILLVIFMSACASQMASPAMLYGTWRGEGRSITFREFNLSDANELRNVGTRWQNGIVVFEENGEKSREGVWSMGNGYLYITCSDDFVSLPYLGSGITIEFLGIEVLSSDTLVISRTVNAEEVRETYVR